MGLLAPVRRQVPARPRDPLADAARRFRMLVEPAGLLEPGFVLDWSGAERCRRALEDALDRPPPPPRLAELDADFHAFLAACSGNPFILHVVRLQNRVRRAPAAGDGATACLEHLTILTAVERGERAWAASLLRRHIEVAGR